MKAKVLLISLVFAAPTFAQTQSSFDYWQFNREMIRRGQQAVFMCNGLFVSNRTLEQVFEQELAYLREPIGTAAGGDYVVDSERRAVAIGNPDGVPVMRAAFREGIGCVVLAPDQTFDDIDDLPILTLPPPAVDPATIPWPDGDKLEDAPLPAGMDQAALQAASDWAFDRESPEQVTLSLLIVHNGRIVQERYAPDVTMETRTRTWSTAKSIAATLIGMLADQGRMSLDAPLGFRWFPDVDAADRDPRSEITNSEAAVCAVRDLLNMSSGLYPIDNANLEYATGSGLSYWAGESSVEHSRRRGLIRAGPGTYWDYENYDTLLAVYKMKIELGDDAYLEFPRRALFDRIGMRNTLVSTDPEMIAVLWEPETGGSAGQVPITIRRFHSEQPGLYKRSGSGAIRAALPARRALAWRAFDLRGLDRLRAHARAVAGRRRKLLWRPMVARPGRPD